MSGDGLADVVGFYDKDVMVSTARAASFSTPQTWATGYDFASGYTIAENPRVLGKIDGAAGADLVGFADDGLHSTSLAIHIDGLTR